MKATIIIYILTISMSIFFGIGMVNSQEAQCIGILYYEIIIFVPYFIVLFAIGASTNYIKWPMETILINFLIMCFSLGASISIMNYKDEKAKEKYKLEEKSDSGDYTLNPVASENEKNPNTNPCSFDKYYQSPQTPKLAKDIYADRDWNLNNDNEALALLDSLTAKDVLSRSFYFKVVTKSEAKSDGYYSEGLGSMGVSYIEKNTIEFLNNFENSECFTDKDLETWADIVMLDFGIEYENAHDDSPVNNYIKVLKNNCINCSVNQKSTLNKFSKMLKKKWREYLLAEESLLDFMQLSNKELQSKFFAQLDSVLDFQYPKNGKETKTAVDLNEKLLNQFLKDIDTEKFLKTKRFEKEYHFNVAPKGFSDPPVCKDKISIEYYPGEGYRMVIYDTFFVEPNWCTEHSVVYGFEIKGNRIIHFGRNEAG